MRRHAGLVHRWARPGLLALVTLVSFGLGVALLTRSGNTDQLVGVASLFVGLASLAVSLAQLPSSLPPPSDAGELADYLALTVQEQWDEEVSARQLRDPRVIPLTWAVTDRPVAGPPDSVVGPLGAARPLRLSMNGRLEGRFDDAATQLARGYRRIPSGRLVVLGEPGAGKTVLALMLTLGLLRDRDPHGPVPVLLSVSTWDPVTESLDDWIVNTLATAYYGSRPDIPRRLLDRRLLLPILDGLDEIPEVARRSAVRALNHAYGDGRSVVLTCRSAEYEDVIRGGSPVLRRAPVVEVAPVSVSDAVAYLQDVSWLAGIDWEPVYEHLRRDPAGALATALSTPLTLSLARTVTGTAIARGFDVGRDVLARRWGFGGVGADVCGEDVGDGRMVAAGVLRDPLQGVDAAQPHIHLVLAEVPDRCGVPVGDLSLLGQSSVVPGLNTGVPEPHHGYGSSDHHGAQSGAPSLLGRSSEAGGVSGSGSELLPRPAEVRAARRVVRRNRGRRAGVGSIPASDLELPLYRSDFGSVRSSVTVTVLANGSPRLRSAPLACPPQVRAWKVEGFVPDGEVEGALDSFSSRTSDVRNVPLLCLGQRAERTRRPFDPAQEPQRRVLAIGPEPGPGPPAEIGSVGLRRRDPASVVVPRDALGAVLAYEARRGAGMGVGGRWTCSATASAHSMRAAGCGARSVGATGHRKWSGALAGQVDPTRDLDPARYWRWASATMVLWSNAS